MNNQTGMLVFILLLVAVVLGFYAGYSRAKRRSRFRFLGGNAYAAESNYLSVIDELADKKNEQDFENFVANLAVDSEALETHFALGNLLRKRGETDKAIRIHQNLLARSNLTKEQLHRVQLELAVDYKKSGLLDRAETLLRELGESQSIEVRRQALESLVSLYQGQNEWERAIEIAKLLQDKKVSRRKDHWALVQCHFCCELAQTCIDKKDWKKAGDWLQKARSQQKNNIRLSLLEVQSVLNKTSEHGGEIGSKMAKQLGGILKSIHPGHPLFQSHVLPLYVDLKHQFPGFDIEDELANHYESDPSEPLMLVLIELALQAGDKSKALELILKETANWPNVKLVADVLGLFENVESLTIDLDKLVELLRARIAEASYFQCSSCGFESATHFWSCPTCKSWESLMPMVRS